MLFRIAGLFGALAHLVDWLVQDRRNTQKRSDKPRAGWARFSPALLIAAALVVGAGVAFASSFEGAANQTSTTYTVGQLVDNPNVGARTYATVTGYVYNWAVQTTVDGKYDHESYLIGDPATDKWIIVESKRSKDDFAAMVTESGWVTVTGMLRPDHGEVSTTLAKLEDNLPSINISRDILLKDGQTPANQTVMLAVAGAAGGLALILLVGWAIGYVVFRAQKTRSGLSSAGLAGATPVRVTGVIPGYFGGERALEKKAELRVSPVDPAAASAAGAPVSLVWTTSGGLTGIDLGPELNRATMGTAYPIRGSRPALRVRYQKANLVFTFDGEEARNQAFDSLRACAGLVAAPEGGSAAR
jgi:hypothetical protein